MAKKEKKEKIKKSAKGCTYIGGQAVFGGGIMMGKNRKATARRDPHGEGQI